MRLRRRLRSVAAWTRSGISHHCKPGSSPPARTTASTSCCSGIRPRTRSPSRSRTSVPAIAFSSRSRLIAPSKPSTTPSPTPPDGKEIVVSRNKHSLAARMGRWSAAHWKTATFGWLAFVLVAFALGFLAGTKTLDDPYGPGESGSMDRILDAGFEQPAGEIVLIQSRSLRAGDPAFKAAIDDVVARLSKVADARNVRKGQTSADGHSALVELDIRGDKDEAVDKIDPVLDAVAAAQRTHPGFVIGEFGDASAQKAVETAYEDDLGKAGTLSLPITLIVLVLTFGALVAAGIP